MATCAAQRQQGGRDPRRVQPAQPIAQRGQVDRAQRKIEQQNGDGRFREQQQQALHRGGIPFTSSDRGLLSLASHASNDRARTGQDRTSRWPGLSFRFRPGISGGGGETPRRPSGHCADKSALCPRAPICYLSRCKWLKILGSAPGRLVLRSCGSRNQQGRRVNYPSTPDNANSCVVAACLVAAGQKVARKSAT